ncbi:hypothetical protein AU210_016758 [Fusarium oxysporum f. sp. radicis-cucumerinum]|uniref:Uncharacterized protein n=1 Tax=Fusarium oxysporum f. sp. radicis-cucumerinum TaxID=327505 RepID=A0A2H3FMP3_FUSOX|nr:hypothetical protein AU210_016758 [Fusarium oxysporum f. sp. radicis-cucumerinum]
MPRMNLGLPYNHCNHQPCQVGFQSPNLLRCGGCHVVKYCGQPTKGRPTQAQGPMQPDKQTRDKALEEEEKLRINPGADTDGSPFDNAVGLFWFFKALALTCKLALTTSLPFSTSARAKPRDRTRPFPRPASSLPRRHYAGDSHYDWRDMNLPFLDMHGEDTFEAVDEKPHHIELAFFVALTLIKIRLMKDLESLQGFLQSNPNATGEARYDHLQEEAMSDILLRRPDIVAQDNYEETIAELRRQALQLYRIVKEKIHISGRAL